MRCLPTAATARMAALCPAMIEDEDEAIARVIRMVTEGKVTANDGTDIAIQADSVCVHGDGPKALAFVEKIGAALQAAGVELKAF